MFLRIEATSDRLVETYVPLDESFKEGVPDFKRFMFEFGIEVFECDELCNAKGKVAQMSGILFDENELTKDDEDIVYWADSESQELYEAMNALCETIPDKYRPDRYESILEDGFDEDKMFERRATGYISTLYVDPDYRQRGIGKYLLDNLYDIIFHHFGYAAHFIVIGTEPYEMVEIDGEESLRYDGAGKEMGEVVLKTMESCGYEPLKNGYHYYKNYCLTSEGE